MLSSKASAEPGAGAPAARPYLKAIMDCLSPTSPVERVVFMKAAQLGATEMGSNWIGYVIHHAPGPMMAVWPTVEMAKRNSKQRIDPLIEESSALAELIAPARSRDSGNTILAKGVSGRRAGDDRRQQRGRAALDAGAVSVLDEVDGYPLDVEGEGDAISLAEARTRTFARRKIFIVSTPTISGARPSSASTRPATSAATSCRARIARAPAVAALRATALGQGAAGDRRLHLRVLRHRDCRAPQDLDAGARRVARDPWTFGQDRGLHLSSLYSPVGWRSWRDIAAAWEAAVRRVGIGLAAIKTFRTPNWARPGSRKAKRRTGNGWSSAARTTASAFRRRPAAGRRADVQKDRIEASIWAFGRGKESRLVEHRVLMGDTARDGVWKAPRLIDEHWTHASGARCRWCASRSTPALPRRRPTPSCAPAAIRA